MPADGILKSNVTTKILMESPLCIDEELAFEEKFNSLPAH
jgi:hypothetical protein